MSFIIIFGTRLLRVAENHRTQTQYNDMLIIKLFAFQFVNSYTSLYYIAFFRGVRSLLFITFFYVLAIHPVYELL